VKQFEYHRPASIKETTTLLARYGGKARVLAGGQSLLNMMKWRLVAPRALIDANRLADLKAVQATGGGVRIGAMARYADLSEAVPPGYGAIHDALEVIADIQVRNLGTLGGSCCQADPFGDMPNVMVALDAEFEARSAAAERRIGVDQFFTGPLQTALAPDELLSAVHLPPVPAGLGSAYEKFAWRFGDFAIAAVAANLTLDAAGRCVRCRLVAGGMGLGPVRLGGAENAVIGKETGDAVIRQAATAAAGEVDPAHDPIYGPADYKRALVETMTARALRRACERALSGSKARAQ
jgi:carbon-monoxide dehydrogenase medium subunit